MAPAPVGKILLLAAGAACVIAAIAFLGLAVFVLWRPEADTAGAAALTALILLLPPAIWLAWKQFTPVRPQIANSQSNPLNILASLARDRPLLAMFGACLFGVADYLLRNRNKKPGRGVLF